MKIATPAAFALLTLALAACGGNSASTGDNATRYDEWSAPIKPQIPESDSEVNVHTWCYSTQKDKISREVEAINADIVSINEEPFGRDGSKAFMLIRLIYGAGMSPTDELCNTVFITFTGDDGRCRLSASHGAGFLATFDGGPVDDTWEHIEMGLWHNSMYMCDDGRVNAFIEKLKHSEQTTIQVNLEDVGPTTFTFWNSGLRWDYTDSKTTSSIHRAEWPEEEEARDE